MGLSKSDVESLVDRLPDAIINEMVMTLVLGYLEALEMAIEASGADEPHNKPHRKRVLNKETVEVLHDIEKGRTRIGAPSERLGLHNQSTLASVRSGAAPGSGECMKEYKNVERVMEALETYGLGSRGPKSETRERLLSLTTVGEKVMHDGRKGVRKILKRLLSKGD